MAEKWKIKISSKLAEENLMEYKPVSFTFIFQNNTNIKTMVVYMKRELVGFSSKFLN